MSRKLRYQPEEWMTHFVTLRCIQSRFLLRPSREVNELVVGVLHRAGQQSEVKLHAVGVLSDHLHLLVTAKTATDLSAYMQFVGSNVSREVGKLHDWPQRFWERRYASALCLDDEAVVDRLGYTLLQGVKEGLVSAARSWPGVHSYLALCEGKKLHGKWVDRTALYEATRSHKEDGRTPTARDHTTWCTLTFDPIPCWAHLAPGDYRSRVKALYDDAVREHRPDGPVLGAKTILRMNPHHRPDRTDRSPAPPCHTADKGGRKRFLEAYRAFVTAYREALAALRAGLDAFRFPEGCVLPAALLAAPLSEAPAPG